MARAPNGTKKKRRPATEPEPASPEVVPSAEASSTRAPVPSAAAPPPTPWWARLAIALAALAAFAPSFTSPLLHTWDDQRFILDEDVLHPSLAGLASFFTEQRYEAYHPLHLLSYWIDVPWVGPNGPVIHVVSCVLWCGVLFLAFEVLRRLGLGIPAALVATIAFGVHPVMVEPVAWASGRKDILAIGFALGALFFHLRARHWNDRDAWISRGLFVLGALAKTSILPLPIALFFVDLWGARRSTKDAAIFQAPAVVAAAALGVIVILIWRAHSMLRGDASEAVGVEMLVVPATFTHQILTVLWPARVSPVYPTSHDTALEWTYAVIGPLVVALSLNWAVLRRKHPLGQRAGLGITWFVLFLLPVSNLLPMYFQWQDRYVAASVFGIALVFGAGVEALATPNARETWIRALVTGAVAIVPLGIRTNEYVRVWSSDRTLWHHAVTAQPEAYFAWIKLGEARRDEGAYDASLAAYAEAIAIQPQTRLGHAAFVYVLGLRDEEREHLDGESHALGFSTRYLGVADDAPGLRDLAAEMLDDGYHDATTYVLGRSFDLEPVDDDRIERAVAFHLRGGREWLARFYMSRMTRRPVMPVVVSFYDGERLRLGLATEEEIYGDVLPAEDPDAPPLPDVEGSGFDSAIDLRE